VTSGARLSIKRARKQSNEVSLKKRLVLAVGLLVPALGGCGADYSPDTYNSNAVQQANKVDRAVVVGVRLVDVSAAGTTGAVAGAAAGGIAGSQAPGGNVAGAFGALGGALVGGLVGTAAEHVSNDTRAREYVVRKDNGDLLSVTQKDTVPLAIGQKVLLIAGNQARIVPDYTVNLEPPKPAAPAKEKPAEPAKPEAAAATTEKPPEKPPETPQQKASEPPPTAPLPQPPAEAPKEPATL